MSIAFEQSWLSGLLRCDTTSIRVYGQYAAEEPAPSHFQSTEQAISLADKPICMTYGHSKEHRPDLKQAVLSIAMMGKGGIPIGMFAHDGNASDKKVLPDTIEPVNAFRQQLNAGSSQCARWIADSALYTAENLQRLNQVLWVSRVPENIKKAQELVHKPEHEINWLALTDPKNLGESEKEEQKNLVAFFLQTTVALNKAGFWFFHRKPLSKKKSDLINI